MCTPRLVAHVRQAREIDRRSVPLVARDHDVVSVGLDAVEHGGTGPPVSGEARRSQRASPFHDSDPAAAVTEQKKSGSDGFVLNNIFEPAKSVPSFRLSGIMVSEAGPVAIINNEIVRKGDSIGGAIIELIESDQVKLSFQGQELVLTVK